MSNIETRVRETIAKSLTIEADQVELNSSFQEDLGADSMEVVEAVLALEREFSINIPDERAERISTVQNAVDVVNEMLSMDS